jgi:hypothetical protein
MEIWNDFTENTCDRHRMQTVNAGVADRDRVTGRPAGCGKE